MSEDLSAIHAQTSAILEKLYDQKGQPQELDATFVHEYLKLVSEQVKIDGEEEEPILRGPHTTDAKLSHPDKGLVEVNIPSKSEKFLVSKLATVKTLNGTSQRIGSDRGKGQYLMTSIKGIPNITIRSGKAIVTFVGFPNKVNTESGSGEWVKV